jgi:nucleotide-binding universal stress UspA family protein
MTVVVGYVPTQTGFSAVTEAEHQARCRSVAVVVVNVVSTAGYVVPTAADQPNLDAVTAHLTAHGVANSLRHVTDDRPPAEVLLAIAGEVGASLIVLGLHQRSWIAKRLLGSTAQSVVLGAPCPVLVVPDIDPRPRPQTEGIEAQPLRFMGQIPT